jgi:hypothetical protein
MLSDPDWRLNESRRLIEQSRELIRRGREVVTESRVTITDAKRTLVLACAHEKAWRFLPEVPLRKSQPSPACEARESKKPPSHRGTAPDGQWIGFLPLQ